MLGVGTGGAIGIVSGFMAGFAASQQKPDWALGLVLAVVAGPLAATAGAVVGAADEILAYLRQVLPTPVTLGPEADYREPEPPAG
jgi:hypothetical protein